MEREILEMIRQEAVDMKKIVSGDYSEIEELKKDSKVQRYLHLIDLKNSRELIEDGERCIVGKIISKYGYGSIKETNGIWCYLFEAPAGRIRGIPVDSADPDQIMVVYQDLEDAKKLIAVSKEEQKEFEDNHTVVYGNQNIVSYGDRYYNTRHRFFKECIDNGQEEAIKKLI